MQQKIEAGLLKQSGAAAKQLQQTIAKLKAKQDAHDFELNPFRQTAVILMID